MTAFPIFKAGTIFNEPDLNIKTKKSKMQYGSVELAFPTRLNAMSIDSAAIASSENNSLFPAGEFLLSIDKFIKVKTKFLGNNEGNLKIGPNTKRYALVNHAYLIMCHILDISPSLLIDVDDSLIIKHSGLGSSGATIAAVCSSINELYGKPIKDLDLISFIASNYGEEIIDKDKDNLKMVQCIGGSVSTGLVNGGAILIAGNSTPIMDTKYLGKAVIGIPTEFVPQSAKKLMELEEINIDNFKNHGETYSREVAYEILNKGLPEMRKGKLSEIAKTVFNHRFNWGSIKNCSFNFPRINEIAENVRSLYEFGNCDMLAMSSVGPAFFSLVSNSEHEEICKSTFVKQDLNVVTANIWNNKYKVTERERL